MKFVSTLLIALAAGLAIYAARRRIKLALTTAFVVYLIMLPIRLLFAAGEVADRLDQIVWPVLGMVAIWLVLRQVSLEYERRKQVTRPPTPRRRRR